MYNAFFGFKETPFDIVPNPDYLYLSQKHKIALDHLEFGLMSGAGFILLTGEIGTGKTTLVRHIMRRSIAPDTEVALIFQTNVTAEQLLNMLLTEFELPGSPGDKPGALDRINTFLVDAYSKNRRVLIIVDEAQNLSMEALEELRMLSNIQSDDRMLLQIMLVGQPELKRKLMDPRLAQFAQRIGVNYHLNALGDDETGEYIRHRLERAGGDPGIFSPEAVAAVGQASGGVPRNINLLCANALLYAYADQRRTVTAEDVELVVAERNGLGGVYKDPGVAHLQPEAEVPATTAQVSETNKRLGALENELHTLLATFATYQMELTRRLETLLGQGAAQPPGDIPAKPDPGKPQH